MDEQRCDPVVLLIDDDEMERFPYRQALEQEDFEIVEAEDGAALEQGTHVSVDFPVPRPRERMGLLSYSKPLGTGSIRAVDAFLTEPRLARA